MDVVCDVETSMEKSSPVKDSLLEDRETGYPPHQAPSTSKNMKKKLKTTTFGCRDVRMKNMIVGTKNDCGRTENDDCGKTENALVFSYRRNGMCKANNIQGRKTVKKWQAWKKLKDGSFGWRPRQLTTYECDIQPVLPIKISTATDMTGTASALGQGNVQHDVHLYSEGDVSGLVGTGLEGTGIKECLWDEQEQ